MAGMHGFGRTAVKEAAMPLRMRAARWYLELYIFMWSPVWRATQRNMVRMQ